MGPPEGISRPGRGSGASPVGYKAGGMSGEGQDRRAAAHARFCLGKKFWSVDGGSAGRRHRRLEWNVGCGAACFRSGGRECKALDGCEVFGERSFVSGYNDGDE
jgi:hypothetical protein